MVQVGQYLIGVRWLSRIVPLFAVCAAFGCGEHQPTPPPALGQYEYHSGLPLGAFTLLDRGHYRAYDPYRDEISAGTYVSMGDVIEFRSGRDQGVRLRRTQGRATVGRVLSV